MNPTDVNLNILLDSLSDQGNSTETVTHNDKLLDYTNLVEERYDNIKKPPNDDRLYRGLILKNGMKVILVSDPSTEESAASLNVSVGYLSDPDELPGLAHLCEHMLFRGSKKYPDTTEFNIFLAQHGGSSNASTMLDCTRYYFDITADHLHDALDRFAQFFLDPLLDESGMESELSSIYSEYEQNFVADHWRLDQLDASSANSFHPYSKFGIGNKNTLELIPKEKGINVHEALLKFYEQWYSANIMALGVYGAESLDELEEIVVNLFSQVKNKKIRTPVWSDHPFCKEQFEHKWYIVPIQEARAFKIIFPMPDFDEDFRAGVEIYICHLLNHEGNGSLLSLLKKLGWSNYIIAGKTIKTARGFNFLLIAIDITEEGMEHVDDIITYLFQYINMLREAGPNESLFKEYQHTQQIDFDFKEKSSAQSTVISIANALLNYPIEDVLHAPYLPTEWQPDLINTAMDYLTPQNIRVHIVGKSFEDITTETEPWFGTKYLKERIPANIISKWSDPDINEEFKLPSKNEFIPNNFDIKWNENSNTKKYPVIIREDPIFRIWFKQDDEFFVPKIKLQLDFENPLVYLDPVNYNCSYAYALLVEVALSEYERIIDIARFSLSIDPSSYGISLSMEGYHDKFYLLLEKVIDKMFNFTFDKNRFEVYKEYYVRNLQNFQAKPPYEHATYHLDNLLADQVWTKAELLEAIKYVTVEKVEQFASQIFSNLHVEGLIYGNLSESEAMEIIKLVENKLTESFGNNNSVIIPLMPKHLMLHRQICLETGGHFLYEVEHKLHNESCTTLHYQCGLQSTESNIHLELLQHIISQPCYEHLRTEEQLGYNVSVNTDTSNGVQGLQIMVQGDKHPQYFEQRIEACIESMLEYLTHLTDEEFEQYKASLGIQRLGKPKTMGAQFNSFWGEISSQQYHFDCDNVEVDYLKTVTKDQIIKFFKEKIHPESLTRSRLAVHIISTANNDADFNDICKKTGELLNETKNADKITKITDIETFKARQSLFPLLKPINNINDYRQQKVDSN